MTGHISLTACSTLWTFLKKFNLETCGAFSKACAAALRSNNLRCTWKIHQKWKTGKTNTDNQNTRYAALVLFHWSPPSESKSLCHYLNFNPAHHRPTSRCLWTGGRDPSPCAHAKGHQRVSCVILDFVPPLLWGSYYWFPRPVRRHVQRGSVGGEASVTLRSHVATGGEAVAC